MTPQEFKAWFDGFNEGVDAVPTEKQWKKIKERVAQIDNVSVTYPVYVDKYRPYWDKSWWLNQPIALHGGNEQRLTAGSGGSVNAWGGSSVTMGYASTTIPGSPTHHIGTGTFDSLTAMNDLGRADIKDCG